MKLPFKLHGAKCTAISRRSVLSEPRETVTPPHHWPQQNAELSQDTSTQTLLEQLSSNDYHDSSHIAFLATREIRGDSPVFQLNVPQSTPTAPTVPIGRMLIPPTTFDLPCEGPDCWSAGLQFLFYVGLTFGGFVLLCLTVYVSELWKSYGRSRGSRRSRDSDVEEGRQDWDGEGIQLRSLSPARMRRRLSQESFTASEDSSEIDEPIPPIYRPAIRPSQRQYPPTVAQTMIYARKNTSAPGPVVRDSAVPVAALAGAYGVAAMSGPRGLAPQSGRTTEQDTGMLRGPPVAASESHHRGDARRGKNESRSDNDFDEVFGRRRSGFHRARDGRQNAYTSDEAEGDEMGRIRRGRSQHRETKEEGGNRERQRRDVNDKYDGDDENKRARKEHKVKKKKKRSENEVEDIIDGTSKWLALLPLAFTLLHDWLEPKGGWEQYHGGNGADPENKKSKGGAPMDSNKEVDDSRKADRGRSRQKDFFSRDDKRSLIDKNRSPRPSRRREEERSQRVSRDSRHEGRRRRRLHDEGKQRSADARQVHGESTSEPFEREGYVPRRRTTRRDARSRHEADKQMSPPHARFRDTVSVASANRNSNAKHIPLNDIPGL